MKKLLIASAAFLGGMLLISATVLAQSLEVYLYYNRSKNLLKFDEKVPKAVVLNEETYTSINEYLFEKEGKKGIYTLKLFDAEGNEVTQTPFDPQDGAFKLELPYFSLATTLKIFETSSNKELLSIGTEEYKSCNTNSICEYELKESLLTCLNDCGTSDPVYSDSTYHLLQQNNGIIEDPQTGETLLYDEGFFEGKTPPKRVAPVPSGSETQPAQGETPAESVLSSSAKVRAIALIVFVIISAIGIIYFIRRKMNS